MKNRVKVDILRKLLCSMLLFIVLSQNAIPTFAAIMDGGEAEKSYKEWINIWASIPSSILKTKDVTKITESVIGKIANGLTVGRDITKSMLEKAENQDKIIIKANYKYDQSGDADNASRKITEFNILEIYLSGKKSEGINGLKSLLEEAGEAPPEGNGVRKTDISYDDLRTTLGKPEEEELDNIILNFVMDNLYTYDGEEGTGDEGKYKNAFRDAAKIVVGSRKKDMLYSVDVWNNGKNGAMSHYAMKGAKLPEENLVELIKSKIEELEEAKKEDQGDLGGWLLDPVFMLVNFVFDSLTSVLGRVMNNNVDGFLYEKTNPTIDTSKLTYKDVVKVNVADFGATHIYHTVTYTPEEIFSGKIDLLSIDFISGTKADGTAIDETTKGGAGWLNIRSVIAQWYKVLRMIAIIGLLSVLIYTGIKIIISANAKDKAKYKEWIINWFIAVAILFSMHYIMAFITSVTGEFSNLLSEANGKVIVEEVQSEAELDTQSVNTANLFETNLMGLVRFRIQDNDMGEKIAYEVMYIALFIYTVKFTFVYLKRVLNMAFLTLIAPIVALTYPIDKLNDGNAQGFNMWLKEYIFNALLQPMHLIMYYILVGSAVSIAASNPLYGIVVLAFMTEAEKLLKKIFGFDKASGGTVGGMAGAFAAGALASNIAKMVKLPKGKGGAGSGSDSGAENVFDNAKPYKDDNGLIENQFGNNLLLDKEDNLPPGNDSENPMNDAEEETTEQANKSEKKQEVKDSENSKEVDKSQDQKELDGKEDEDTIDAEQNDLLDNKRDEEKKDSPDNRVPITTMARIKAGAKNVGKTLLRPIHDIDRNGTGYNKHRWKRRGVKALKGLGRAYVGASLGIAAAAVQAGISITDGKYNPMEGMASFAAGYTGAGQITKGFGKISYSFKEGYYQGNDRAKIEKQKEEFKYSDETYKAYRNKYSDKSTKEINQMIEVAAEHLVPYGYKDPKEQFQIQSMANKIKELNKNASIDQVMKQARNTKGFIDTLESQGQKGIINNPDKQAKYIEAIAKSKGYAKNSEEYIKLERGYNNAFKSAAVWQQVNKK